MYEVPAEAVLNQSIDDVTVVNEKIRMFYKQGMKSYEDFDDIVLQIQMHFMSGTDIVN